MFKVTNTAKGERSFWHTDPETGVRKLARLEGGKSGVFDVNPGHAAFRGDDLKVEATSKKAKADQSATEAQAPSPTIAD